MSRFLRSYGDVVFTGLMILLFAVWPSIDLALVDPFYEPGVGFQAREVWWIKIIYMIVARFWVLALLFTVLLLAGIVPRFRSRWAHQRKALIYLLVALVIGPGLIVNSGLKNHWGRPRPVQLARYGGNARFTPALVPSHQCPHNCAFASGHAAAAFFPMAGYWLTRRRRWLVGGIAFGLLVGYIRIAMGAHFLSDIVFAGLIVHFTCRWLAYLFGYATTVPEGHGKLEIDETVKLKTSDIR